MADENGTETDFECPVCGATFGTEADRDEHITQNHPD